MIKPHLSRKYVKYNAFLLHQVFAKSDTVPLTKVRENAYTTASNVDTQHKCKRKARVTSAQAARFNKQHLKGLILWGGK